MPISQFAERLAFVATNEHRSFGNLLETDPRLRKRIYDTYLADLADADPDDRLGWSQNPDISKWPWSAAFVSWCVLKAGATRTEFDFSIRHAIYIKKAIANTDNGRGVFHARFISAHAPRIGDVIAANGKNGSVTYNQARNLNSYSAHSAIVVELVERAGKHFAVTVGGNEQDAIRRTEVELRNGGFVRQRPTEPYICVIQNLK